MNDFDARSLSLRGARATTFAFGAALFGLSGSAHADPTPAPVAAAATPAPDSTPAAPEATAPAAPSTAAAKSRDDSEEDGPPDSDAAPAVPKPKTPPHAAAQPQHAPKRSQPDEPLHRDDGRMGTHQEHWLVGLGLRESFIAHSGFDPFSTNNVLPQFSVDAGRVLFASGPFSFAALALFDYGSAKATARGADTSLNVARVTAAGEGRYHFWRRFYVFGRIAPGALYTGATLKDPVAGVDQKDNAWAFASDFSLGAAVEFAGEARGASSLPRGWLGFDGGYGYAQATKLALKPSGNDANAPARLETVALGDLAVRGGFFRVNGTVTF
jgi:hypothetical protein